MSDVFRQPAAFFAHGSPMVAIEEDEFTRSLRDFGKSLPRPRAIVVVSAHWEAPGPIRVTLSERPPLIYDFSGFPEELYAVRYDCPGDRALALEVGTLLSEAGQPTAHSAERGLDHGVWVPLRHAFPAADVPVVEVSLPTTRSPEQVAAMGKALAPLRERGVLLVGSGGIVHNLRRVRFDDKRAAAEAWAKDFDLWVRDRLQALDVDGLSGYPKHAPNAALAVPTSEHFDPVFFVLGAALPGDRVRMLFEGFHHGTLSMRSFSLDHR
ncbi:MAG TPA: class III extradiol ring-cleavage dioxygenase [Planctomycetota bacterium]|jgi:4,5-DOPA dioxygenase extradiol|nr:class III extradiol ring-cleavage dioxygenase [Planctomycetota bacterium]